MIRRISSLECIARWQTKAAGVMVFLILPLKGMAIMKRESSKQLKQNGFTIIELILVIVIIGILAAVAIPRFTDLESDARASSIQGLLGAVKSAAMLAHAKSLTQGDPSTAVDMEGVSVAMVNGYPSGASGGINNAVNIDAIDYTFSAGSPAVFTLSSYSGSNCQVTYSAPSAANTSPAIGFDISGC